jgi:hypothetical protein
VSCRSFLLIRSLSPFSVMSIGKRKGRVPWAELQRAPDDYIEAKYLPKGVALRQYYHLRQDAVNEVLEHWTERQAAGEVPFQFKEEIKAARKNKRTSDDNDTDTGRDPREDSEEDRQSDNDGQARVDAEFQGDGDSNLPDQGLEFSPENPNRVGWFLKHSGSRLISSSL